MKTLRIYQKAGYTEIWECWDGGEDVLMFVLATGGGKTVTFTEIIREILIRGKKVMLIAHRQELIMQAWQTLFDNQIFAGVIMGSKATRFDLPCQVCSIQTLARRTSFPPADYIIIDEGHHVQKDNTYAKVLSFFPFAKILMVTATPYRLSGDGFEYIHPKKKTKLIVNRTLGQLQQEGYLVPLRCFAASLPDLSDAKLRNGDYIEEDAEKAMSLVPLVDSYLEHAKGKSGVVFTVNVAHSIKTVQQYLYAGVPAEHLDANTPDKMRVKILSDFKCGLVKIISNVGIITEGFDFPNLEMVQLAKPTKSLSLYLQMVGRVTRPEGGCIDGAINNADRVNRIKQSKKPCGLVLDNAGCFTEHLLPDYDHDWNKYFIGKKKGKKLVEEVMEMLVFVAEDQFGRLVRTTNPKEIEGMRLVEVTKEAQQKLINLKSIKEFDRLYFQFKNMKHIKKPGHIAMLEYMEYCKKNNILMVDEVWSYLYNFLVVSKQTKLTQLLQNRANDMFSYPDELFLQTQIQIENEGINENWFKIERSKYEADNRQQMQAYRMQKNSFSV